MSMIAQDNGGIVIPKLENGVYTAVSKAIIDLGIQKSEKFGNSQRKFILLWEIPGETIEVNGETLNRQMSKEYSFSLGEKSNLRKDLQAWRGKTFTDEELKGFNLLNILNRPCQLQILLTENNGRQYNNIAAIMALPKGMEGQTLDNVYHFDIEDELTWNNWKNIPQWIQDRIMRAENYDESELSKYITTIESNEDTLPADDLPF